VALPHLCILLFTAWFWGWKEEIRLNLQTLRMGPTQMFKGVE